MDLRRKEYQTSGERWDTAAYRTMQSPYLFTNFEEAHTSRLYFPLLLPGTMLHYQEVRRAERRA